MRCRRSGSAISITIEVHLISALLFLYTIKGLKIMRIRYRWPTTMFSTALNPGRRSQFSQTSGMAEFLERGLLFPLEVSRIWMARKPASCYFETSPQGDIDRLKRWIHVETADKVRFSFKLLVRQPTLAEDDGGRFQFGTS